MHDLFERLREALSHATIESIFGHQIAEAIGGFPGNVAASFVAGLIATTIGVGAGWFAWFELPGRLKARTIRRGDPNRLNILLARFEGEGSRDIKDRVEEQLDKVFGEIVDRPFEVTDFPITLRAAQSGKETTIRDRVVRKGRRWLRRAQADLLIWGRARNIADQATIYFLMPHDPPAANDDLAPATGAPKTLPQTPQGTRVYDFGKSPSEFGADAATAIAIAAVMCVRPVFEAATVRRYRPKYALAVC